MEKENSHQNLSDEVQSESEETSPELQKYQQDGQVLIDSYQRFFMAFAQDVSLRFKLSDAFKIDLESGEVNLDTKWFADKNFSQEQIIWANLHELSHFRDLASDAEGTRKNFNDIFTKAKATGATIAQKWEEKYGVSDPDFVEKIKTQIPVSKKEPGKTLNAAEQAAYKIHHTFYNIFDDIYVNSLVSRRAPKYEKDSQGGGQVETLYKDQLFKEKDYQNLPRHMQFLYKLLRDEMVSSEQSQVSGEVDEALKRKTAFLGKEYSAREIVENFLKPKSGRDTKSSQRYFVLQKTLEPIFMELLTKDLTEWEPEKAEEKDGKGGSGGDPQAGDANPWEQEYHDFAEKSPDQLSEEEMRDWQEKNEKDKQEAEAQKSAQEVQENKSAEEKAQESQEAMNRAWCEKNNIDYKDLQNYRRLEAEVEPYLAELSALWQRIIFGTSKQVSRGMEGYFKTGTELDIQKTIQEWPKIEQGHLDKIEVMKRQVEKEVLIKKPELIRVRLVGDLSGSMDNEKKHILQQCFVLILSSLREFNTYLNLSRSQTKSKLQAETEAWAFGDNAEKIKAFENEAGQDDQLQVIANFSKLNQDKGGTYDNKALEAISSSLGQEEKDKISQEKIMEIVFEITDGGSSDPQSARAAVDQLSQAGVITRAFQIGQVSEDEKQTFNNVWNQNRQEKLGEIIGPDIRHLIPTIAELLKNYLGGVRL